MFRIRFHGRGGQGIKTAAQILGTAFFRAGFEVQDAPRYGAERRGAPIFAYVRADRSLVSERGVIARPDLVIVADETLVSLPAAGVLPGIDAHTVLLLNSAATAEEWRQRLKITGPVIRVPGVGHPEETAEIAHLGVVCAGAAARLVGVISRAALAEGIEEELLRLPPEEVKDNLDRALAAFDALSASAGLVHEGPEQRVDEALRPEWIELGLDGASLATSDIEGALTSELSTTGSWRTLRPVIDYERCNRCSWVCSTLCPDGAIRVEADHTPRIDFDHCKGCMVCMAVCPPQAISAVAEREAREEVQ